MVLPTLVKWNMNVFVDIFFLCCSYNVRLYFMHVSIVMVDACKMEDPSVQRVSILPSFGNHKEGRRAS